LRNVKEKNKRKRMHRDANVAHTSSKTFLRYLFRILVFWLE